MLPTVVSRLSAILACLLALLVASPLCCCAAEVLEERAASCCCGDPAGEKEPCHRCPCASDDPREIPDPAVLPRAAGVSLVCAPAPVSLEFVRRPAADPGFPVWRPSPPWHAPPGERRARLVSRLL